MRSATTFDGYWQSVLDEVQGLKDGPVRVEDLPLRSNETSDAYGLRFSGVGAYPLFAYLTVPSGAGPFPPLFQAPGYGSVVTVPAYERRSRYAVLALCHRGQRLSDSGYSAAYPGLLTDGVADPNGYRWQEIVADCLRAVDVLMARPEVDAGRLAVAGNDLAAITAALRPEARYLLVAGEMLFRGTWSRIGDLNAYPLRELADYVRTFPQQADAVSRTLSLFDPLAFAPRIGAETLVTCGEGDRDRAAQLVEAIGARAQLKVNSGYGYLDHKAEEEWLAARLTQ